MSKMLVVLSKGGIMENVSDSGAPYSDVRFIDCQNGEGGDVFEFPASWEGLIKDYFGDDIPHYVKIIDAKDEPSKEYKRALVEMVSEGIAQLRSISDEPFHIPVSEDGRVGVEIMPSRDDDRVCVSCRFMGDTVVNYTDDGLIIDVFRQIRSLWSL